MLRAHRHRPVGAGSADTGCHEAGFVTLCAQNTVNQLSLGHLTAELAESGLTITRASVKPSPSCAGCAEHTFFIIDDAGEVPEASLVESSCSRAGGQLLSKSAIHSFRPSAVGIHTSFSFSCIEKNWRKEWGMRSGSSNSSRSHEDV